MTHASLDLLAAIDHAASSACVRAERALLAALDGSCHTPIAGYADIVRRGAASARPDRAPGRQRVSADARGPARPRDAEALGRDAGEELRTRAGAGFFD